MMRYSQKQDSLPIGYADKLSNQMDSCVGAVRMPVMIQSASGYADATEHKEFYFHRPKTVKREQPTVKPDLDNCIKSILDGLNPHQETYGITKGAWADDGQVVEIHAVKRYTDGEEKAIVRIEDYEHD